MKCTCKEETKYRSRDGESIKKVVRCVGKRKRLSFSYRVRVYVTETRDEKKRVEREEREARKKTGWRNEGREFELNYILISQPFRSAHRDMPNIRCNLHFKLDTSCRDSRVSWVSSVAGIVWRGCCRFHKKHARLPLSDGDFRKLERTRCALIPCKNQPSISSPSQHSYTRVFYFFNSCEKIVSNFLCYVSP